jgi:Flp pilus assembly pilin Flp
VNLHRRGLGFQVLRVWARVSARWRLLGRDDGLAITEYGMLVAFAALALIALAAVFGSQIAAWFAAKTGAVTTV